MIDMDSMKKLLSINLIKMDVNDPRGNKYFRVSTLNAQKNGPKHLSLHLCYDWFAQKER